MRSPLCTSTTTIDVASHSSVPSDSGFGNGTRYVATSIAVTRSAAGELTVESDASPHDFPKTIGANRGRVPASVIDRAGVAAEHASRASIFRSVGCPEVAHVHRQRLRHRSLDRVGSPPLVRVSG